MVRLRIAMPIQQHRPTKNRFPAALYELNYIGIEADGRHSHNDEELAESFQWHKYFIWYAGGHAYSCDDGSGHKEKYKKRKNLCDADALT